MPLDQHIEGRHRAREPGVEISPHAAHDPLAMTDHGEPRGHRLHQQAILPRAARTQFQVGWIALRGMEGGVT